MVSLKRLVIVSGIMLVSLPLLAQTYSSLDDTAKINKKLAVKQLELAKLNNQLVEAQNKVKTYQNDALERQQSASQATQRSADKATAATTADPSDTKEALREAKKADKAANAAKKAQRLEKRNQEEIADLTERISKKQDEFQLLSNQKASLLGQPQAAPASQDSMQAAGQKPDSTQ